MRVFLSGSKRLAAEVYAGLREAGHEIAGVATPLGDRLALTAQADGLPVIPSGTLNKGTLPEGVDLIVAAHSHDFIGEATRLRAKWGAVGYHPSLLPVHRGRDAIRWAVHMKDRVTGGSVYWLSNTMDGGPIAAQEHCFIRPDDTAESLWRRELMPMGVRLLLSVVADVAAGRIVRAPQDEELATWEPSWDRPPVRRPDLLLIPRLGPYNEIREALRLYSTEDEDARPEAAA